MATGRRERKKQELRERIVDVANDLIARQGLTRTTVDQIAEATDIAAGQEHGEVRRDQTPGALADAVLGLYVSVMLFWSTDADYPGAERLRTSLDLALHLIAPPAGPPTG